MKALQTRLDLILERIESPKFLKNDGLGNEIGFWVFDYPAKYELLVREHLKHVDEKLNKRGYRFVHLNIFEVLIDMLEERGLFDRACQRELQVGVDGLDRAGMHAPGLVALGAGVGHLLAGFMEVEHLDARLGYGVSAVVLERTSHLALQTAGAFFGVEVQHLLHEGLLAFRGATCACL